MKTFLIIFTLLCGNLAWGQSLRDEYQTTKVMIIADEGCERILIAHFDKLDSGIVETVLVHHQKYQGTAPTMIKGAGSLTVKLPKEKPTYDIDGASKLDSSHLKNIGFFRVNGKAIKVGGGISVGTYPVVPQPSAPNVKTFIPFIPSTTKMYGDGDTVSIVERMNFLTLKEFLSLYSSYEKECYADSTVSYYFTVCDGKCYNIPCERNDINFFGQKCSERWTHKSPSFPGFMEYLKRVK